MPYPHPENPIDRALDLAVYEAQTHYEQYGPRVRELLQLGGNANLMIEGGTSLIWRTVNPLSKSFYNKGLQGLAKDLIDSGANPMINDHIFESRLFSKSALTTVLLMTQMAQVEAVGPHRFRDASGGNPLHLLCESSPEWLSSVLECWASKEDYPSKNDRNSTRSLANPPTPVAIQSSWLNEARPLDGKTPLHMACDRYLQKKNEITFSIWNQMGFWRICLVLLEQGARVDIKDHAGQDVSTLVDQALPYMGDMFDGEKDEDMQVVNRVCTLVSAGVLHAQTHPAPSNKPAVPAVRL